MVQTSRLHGTCLNPAHRRLLAVEKLERRDLLTGVLPTVVGVQVASTSWAETFYQHLGADGYSIPVGSAAQMASLTWSNIDQIKIKFNEDVDLDAADLSVSGINTTAFAFSDFHYDPIAHLATWTFATPLDKDRLQLDLDASGLDPVRDLDGNILDGEWTNKVSLVSGNGTAGGDFQFTFHVQPTDVDNNGRISSIDSALINLLNGKTTTSPGYLANRDIDGSGLIDQADRQEAIDRYFEERPLGSPAGANNDAPTTSGFNLTQITNAAIDVAVSLTAGFGDAENGSSGLTYSIVSNSNTSMFDSAYVNQSTKQLVLNAASGASGRANIVLRGTDSGGLFVDTSITVDANYQNQAPSLTLYIDNIGSETWWVSGDVSDSDDDVSNFIIVFYQVFNMRSAVDEFGHFAFAVTLDEGTEGWEYAKTFDPHGAQSNVALAEVKLT